MSSGLYSGVSGLALGVGLYKGVGGLWGGASGLIDGFGGFSPATLFAAGEPGGWYDPSDLSTMFQDSAGTTPVTATGQTVGLLLDKSGRGNHLTQATAASRPIYGIEPFGGRRNLLVRTEEFENAAWSKNATGTLLRNQTDPVGTADSATTLVANNAGGSAQVYIQQIFSTTLGASYAMSVYLKQGTQRYAVVNIFIGFANSTLWFDLQSGTCGVIAGSGATPTIVNVGNQWFRCTVSATAILTTAGATLRVAIADDNTDVNYLTPRDGTSSILIWGAQVETGSLATAYQRVTDQWNVTQAGVPSVGYLAGDFVDDNMTFNGSTMTACESAYVTENGWMVGGASGSNYGSLSRIPLGRVTGYIVNPNIKINADQLTSYFGVDQYYFVGMTTDSTVFHRIDSPAGAYPITYVGANGVTYTQTANNLTTDLIAQGLTSPFTMLVPKAVMSDNQMTRFYCNSNQLTGSIPDLSANTALTQFHCYTNQLTGSIPDLSANTALTVFYCNSNQLTGSIPDLSANTALTQFYCDINRLTGNIPDLSANTALTQFLCYSNQLTGNIPDLSANTALTLFYCNSNQLTGNIPDLSANTALTLFHCNSNQLTGWSGGTVSADLGSFQAQNNLLTQAAVDAILAAFVAAGRTTGTRILNIGGTGNAAPSAAGLADKATLESRGWTVTTN